MQKRQWKILLSLLLVAVLCFGAVPALARETVASAASSTTYYNGITATSGTALLGQLHDLITRTHTKYTTYDECGSASNTTSVYRSDPGSNSNYLREFYTQADISRTNFDKSGGWNREHVWPKANSNGIWPSTQKTPTGGGADLHHVRPAEKDLNNARGNYKYGNVSTKNSSTEKKASGTNIVGGWLYGSTFEPLDNVKGDVARILFYVYTHYNTYSNVGGTTNGSGSSSYFGTLQFTHNVTAVSEAKAIELLLAWNELDPVDDIERTRNEAVYGIQGNRNPFIDNQNYANAIWGGTDLNALQSISLQQNLSVEKGATITLTPTLTPTNASVTLSWQSSNPSVATVSNGTVRGVSVGTTTITVTDTKTNKSATTTVTVKDFSSLSVSGTPTKTKYAEGETFNPSGLTVTVVYTDGSQSTIPTSSCQWLDGTTLNPTLSAGTSTVVCKYGNTYAPTSVTISVTAPVVGNEITITKASFTASEYGTQIWSSGGVNGIAYVRTITDLQLNSNKTACYVASNSKGNGKVLFVKLVLKNADANKSYGWSLYTSNSPYSEPTSKYPTTGTLQGAKTATEGNNFTIIWDNLSDSGDYFTLNYTSSTGVCYVDHIEVVYGEAEPDVPVQDSVSLDVATLPLTVEGTATITATASGSVSWSSSDESVATVSGGVVTAVGVGTATITATCGTATATCAVTVAAQIVPDRITLESDEETVLRGSSVQLVADASGEVAWASSDPAVATVNNGLVVGLSVGTVTITATCGTASANCLVHVEEPITLLLDKNDATMLVGESTTVTATTTGEGTLEWTSSNPEVADVVEGTIYAIGRGTATITVTFGTERATCNVTVTDIDRVSLDQIAISLIVGNEKKLTDTSNGTVTWKTSNPSVATVSPDGLVTAVGAGTATITATCGEATATCTVSVTESVEEVIAFSGKVADIAAAETRVARFVAIQEAISVYVTLTDGQKKLAQADVAKLQTAIQAYNAEVASINNKHVNSARSVLVKVAVSTLPAALLGVVLLIKKKWL